MRIGILAPHLNALGGGEKYICKLAEVASGGHNVEIICFRRADKALLQERLGVDLRRVELFRPQVPRLPARFSRLGALIASHRVSRRTRRYDLFFNQATNSIVLPRAKRNLYLCQLPTRSVGSLWALKLVDGFLVDTRLLRYQLVVTQSQFNKARIEKWFPHGRVRVLYPPIDVDRLQPLRKENTILHVGRFFVGGHCKKQLEMIRTFKSLHETRPEVKHWSLSLVGSADDTPSNQGYLALCREEAAGYPISIDVNIPYTSLLVRYGTAELYWHATGLDEDEDETPDRMEHFGITTVEAMAAGCVPVVLAKGGQPEIVRHGVDGLLWHTREEQMEATVRLVKDERLRVAMRRSSVHRSQAFAASVFERGVLGLIESTH